MMAEVQNGQITFLQGNPHASRIQGALCARGEAGLGLIGDKDRPKFPLIRDGERGSGKWRQVTWDEALDYTAERLKAVINQYGGRSILWSDRGGPFTDLHQAFMRALGSPNYCNHDVACARNVQHAALSLFGSGRKSLVYDFKNSKHVILQTRNLFEAINVKEVNDLLDAMEKGCKLTVIDIRATVTASKADRFFLVRPGTDYAFNLAVIHVLLNHNLYDSKFSELWINDPDQLRSFVKRYTPEFAEQETGVPAHEIVEFARDLAKAAPSVLWHPGWMTARYKNSFYVSRSAYIINALLGSVGAGGGLPLANTPADVGRKGLRKLVDLYPKPEEKRADGVGWKYKQFDVGPGLLHLAFEAIETEDPYPVKAYIPYRHDPLMAMADPERMKKTFDKLDFLCSVTFSWSDTAWYSDVVLPLSPYLERESILACKNGLKPYFFLRNRVLDPRFDTRADWEILCGLAKRLSLDKLAFDSIQDIWNYQLEGTGVSMADFEATGMVPLCDEPLYRSREALKFKTPSGRIEIINPKWEGAGLASLNPYESPARPPEGQFRITFGRIAVHTQGHTVNNPLLHEQMPENVLWINTAAAKKLGIEDGQYVEVSANGYSGQIKAYVTDFIHPECVFMVHGFGHKLPVESRAFGKGVADNRLMTEGNKTWDPAGGGLALQEYFVTVRKL